MRRTLTIAAALVAASVLTTIPLGAAATTLKGEVVDVQCNLKDAKNKGADHADCALSCARRGSTLGILTADGVYTITGDYTLEKLNAEERATLQKVDARIEFLPFLPGFSTTSLIARIKAVGEV